MKHADKLIKRILFLDGLPNLQDLNKLAIGETVLEILTADLALEVAGRTTLVAGVGPVRGGAGLRQPRDPGRHPQRHREHIDFLETQLGLFKSLGEQNYLQSALANCRTSRARPRRRPASPSWPPGPGIPSA